MRTAILLTLFSTLALGVKVKRATQCEAEVASAMTSVSESMGRCGESQCPYMCAMIDQGFTDASGTLTLASMAAGIDGRCSGELCTRVLRVTEECLNQFGGFLGPETSCEHWDYAIGCIAVGLDNICDGVRRLKDIVSFLNTFIG